MSPEEVQFDDRNGELTLPKGDNMVYKILHGFLKQGNKGFINIATNAVRRAANNRLAYGNRASLGDDFELQIDEDEKREHGFERKSGPLISGIAYCISSCSMILLNKVVLSSYGFNAGISLMLYQNFVCVAVIIALEFFGAISTERLTWKLIRIWIPVNLIFVGMLVTGMYSLKYINVAMVTILKNVTNILTAIGEAYIFKKRQNKKVWTALFLMVHVFLLLMHL